MVVKITMVYTLPIDIYSFFKKHNLVHKSLHIIISHFEPLIYLLKNTEMIIYQDKVKLRKQIK